MQRDLQRPLLLAGLVYRTLIACLQLSLALLPVTVVASAAEETEKADEPWLRIYTGPTRTDIDATTLDGKVLCGYQGWFNTPGDGSGFGFVHWGQGLERTNGGRFTIDMWPDLSEYAEEDLREVPGLKMPDGSPARLYSAYRPGPVSLHFQWMRQYGIDGVFLSRFISETLSPSRFRHVNQVLANVREGCHREGRVWAMMLDLSTGRNANTAAVINDWKFLCDQVKVREDSRYLHHENKPVVLLWGLGFNDRPWTPEQGEELVRFFKDDPKYGGVYLIGGIDAHWRTLGGSSRTNAAWAEVYRKFDSVSPWNAGRYRDNASMDHIRKYVWEGDLAELKPKGIGYLPTAFPGFSWDNLQRTAPGTSNIPRRKGEFYWRQFAIFKELGVRSVFVGMFDEVDEGTAIYKVSNTAPVGKHFVTYEGLPTDYYLKLTGAATLMMRGEAPLSRSIPERLPQPVKTVLGVQDTRFTLNGEPVFLLGLSYYAGLGASADFIRRDLDDLQRHGFNWLRVWATWAGFDHDVSAVDDKGEAREPFLAKLKWLVAECDRRGLVVDVTLTRNEGKRAGPTGLPNFAAHQRAVETIIEALKEHRNWYLDLANERDVGDARFVRPSELKSLRELARRLAPDLVVTASFGGHDLSDDDIRDALITAGSDFLAPHRPREKQSPSQTEAQARASLSLARSLGCVVPVHYQEPFRRGYAGWNPSADDFLTDLRGAISGGAAGWCFHNGSERGAPNEQPRRSFDLREKRLFDQLDSEEQKFVKGAKEVLK